MVRLKGNPTPLSAVVFDLGNVLVDYNPPRHMFKLGIPPEHIPRMMEILDKRPEWVLASESEEQTHFDIVYYYRTYLRRKDFIG